VVYGGEIPETSILKADDVILQPQWRSKPDISRLSSIAVSAVWAPRTCYDWQRLDKVRAQSAVCLRDLTTRRHNVL
jgi:hypothetical protein